jgi:hypothetical protein
MFKLHLGNTPHNITEQDFRDLGKRYRTSRDNILAYIYKALEISVACCLSERLMFDMAC